MATCKNLKCKRPLAGLRVPAGWKIDHSTGRPILMYENCIVAALRSGLVPHRSNEDAKAGTA